MLSLFVSLMAAVACCSAAPARVSPLTESIVDKVWVHIDGPWESPPPEIGLNERTAPATLIRFEADGAFSMMHCYVIEYAKKLTISNGDGQAIFLGLWSETGSTIDSTFRLAYETVQPVGGRRYPGPEEKTSAMIIGHSIRFRGAIYDEAKTLDVRNYEEFIRPERAKLNGK
jgi:hypothetical protein